jgi:Fe2+ transport system protein FeoA
MRISRMTRLSEQARYQRSYRAEQKVLRKPSRDDVARVALHVMITDMLERNRDGELDALCEALVIRLVDLGFDRDAAYCRVHDALLRDLLDVVNNWEIDPRHVSEILPGLQPSYWKESRCRPSLPPISSTELSHYARPCAGMPRS